MSEAQVELLTTDFLEGLDYWESTWCTPAVTMWQALEASRYAECNPVYGRADVDLAVKLLVPVDVAEDAAVLKKQWGIKPSPHLEGNEMFNTRFSITPAPNASSSGSASLGSSRGRTPSPAQAPDVPPRSPKTAVAAGVSAVAALANNFTPLSHSDTGKKLAVPSAPTPTCAGASLKLSTPTIMAAVEPASARAAPITVPTTVGGGN